MIDLDTLLPHRPPMRLIDVVEAVTLDHAQALARIGDDHPFLVAGRGVPAWVGVEMMAQCTALIGGERARRAGGRTMPGYLLGCRSYRSDQPWFLPGSELRIRGHELMQDGVLAVYQCEIERDGLCIATGRLNIHTGGIADE